MSVFNTRVETGYVPASPSGYYPQLRLFIGMHREPIVVWQGSIAVETNMAARKIAENQMVDRMKEIFSPTSEMAQKMLVERKV